MKLPQYMKAAQARDYGDVDEMISVQDNVPVPNLQDEIIIEENIHPMMKQAIQKDSETHMIIQTLAVALAPGDARVLSGKTRRMQGPPKFPYIVGGDCCGIVVDPGNATDYFSKGDLVAARFSVAPRNALAEYARVSSSVCEKVPPNVTPEEAAALASASPAVELADYFRPKERVLILGAGGGVGSHLCQVARHKQVAYICGVSSDPQRLLEAPLNYDDAIDYTKENIYESKKYQEEPFDTIIDLASGGWPELLKHRRNAGNKKMIVKPASQGGRFITITADTPNFDGMNLFSMLVMFLFKPLGRKIWSRLLFNRNSVPAFTHAMALPETRDVMTKTMRLAKEGQLEAVMDGPYSMTTEGVQQAFHTLQNRHAKGKVVIQVANKNSATSVGTDDESLDA